jgi:hypothetical protein
MLQHQIMKILVGRSLSSSCISTIEFQVGEAFSHGELTVIIFDSLVNVVCPWRLPLGEDGSGRDKDFEWKVVHWRELNK